MFEDSVANELARQKKRLKELELRDERLAAAHEECLLEIGLTADELYAFSTDPDNFSAEEWEEMEDARKQLEIKLKLGSDNCRTGRKSDLGQVQSNWLFVR